VASLTIRALDDLTKQRLRVRAARKGRSMEDEARNILRDAVARDDAAPTDLAAAIAARMRDAGGGVDLE
jgi:plasmid stability protein